MQVQLVAQIHLFPTEFGGRFTPLLSGADSAQVDHRFRRSLTAALVLINRHVRFRPEAVTSHHEADSLLRLRPPRACCDRRRTLRLVHGLLPSAGASAPS